MPLKIVKIGINTKDFFNNKGYNLTGRLPLSGLFFYAL
jgi:hypothetical protein